MISKKPSILIVDDEQVVCDVLCDELNEQDYICATASNANEALKKLVTQSFDVVLLDIKLPGMSGMKVLEEMRSNYPDTAPIMITGVNEVDTAVQAMKLGALDYIVKPFNLERVSNSIRTALENKKFLSEKTDCEIPRCVGGEEKDKEAMEKPSSQLNAIACGVEARQELLTRHSKMVTQTTIAIAQQLNIADKEIQRWAATRARPDAKRNAAIKFALDKLQRSPLGQEMMGMAVPHLYAPKSDKSQN